MVHSNEFKELLRAIDVETGANPGSVFPGLGRFSQMREGLGHTFDCFYSGENLVPYEWEAPDGTTHSDYKVGDICIYKDRYADILKNHSPLYQYCLTLSGVVTEKVGPQISEATVSDLGFLLAVVTSD